MRNFFAVWSWESDGRRQEITMSFWARTESSARDQANAWFATAAATSFGCDFTITDLSQEAQ